MSRKQNVNRAVGTPERRTQSIGNKSQKGGENLRRGPVAPYKRDKNMKFNLNEATSKIEKEVFEILTTVRREKERELTTFPRVVRPLILLSDVYTTVRAKLAGEVEVTAGLFNKVVDDMCRIGLLQVDRRTKGVVDISEKVCSLNGDKAVSQ